MVRSLAIALLLATGQALANDNDISTSRAGNFLFRTEAAFIFDFFSSSSARAYGGGVLAGVTAGTAVSDGVVVGLHGVYSVTPNPSASVGGPYVATNGLDLGFWGVGCQVIKEFGSGGYLGGALMMTQVTGKYQGLSAQTNLGVGSQLSLGKEWWFDRVGLGISSHIISSINPTSGSILATIGFGGGLSLAVR